MTWDDDRDFVDDFVDGLSSGLTSGITAPTVATKPAFSAAVASLASPIAKTVLAPSPSASPAPVSTPSLVLHTPLTTIATPLQKASAPAAAGAAAQALQSAAAKVGGMDVVLATPGTAPHVETPPVADDLMARLRAIRGALLAIRAQNEASSEHRSLMKRDDFRKSVIARLSRIESRLPASSAAAEQIRTIKVLL